MHCIPVKQIILNSFLDSNIEGSFFLEVVMLYVLFGMDIATTAMVISVGGYEMNALMIPVVGNNFIHLLVKGSILIFIVVVAQWADLRVRHSGLMMMGVIIAWYALVVVHNTSILIGMCCPTGPVISL
jgi:hypothetical protein